MTALTLSDITTKFVGIDEADLPFVRLNVPEDEFHSVNFYINIDEIVKNLTSYIHRRGQDLIVLIFEGYISVDCDLKDSDIIVSIRNNKDVSLMFDKRLFYNCTIDEFNTLIHELRCYVVNSIRMI